MTPAAATPLHPKEPCPECGRPAGGATHPFCSPRCKAVDLNRWLSGAYVIPGAAVEDPDERLGGDGSSEDGAE